MAKVVLPAPFGPAMIRMRLVKTTAQLQERVDGAMKESAYKDVRRGLGRCTC